MLDGIGCTTIKSHVFIPTKDMWKLRNKPTPLPKMKKSPQQIEHSSTLLEMGHVRYLSFACNCQTHGDATSFVLFLPICAPLRILTVCQTTLTKNMCGKNQTAFSAPPFLQCIVMSGLMEGSEGCPVGYNGKGWWNLGKIRKMHIMRVTHQNAYYTSYYTL